MWSAVESIGTTALVVFIVFYFIYMIIRTLAYRRERLTWHSNVHRRIRIFAVRIFKQPSEYSSAFGALPSQLVCIPRMSL